MELLDVLAYVVPSIISGLLLFVTYRLVQITGNYAKQTEIMAKQQLMVAESNAMPLFSVMPKYANLVMTESGEPGSVKGLWIQVSVRNNSAREIVIHPSVNGSHLVSISTPSAILRSEDDVLPILDIRIDDKDQFLQIGIQECFEIRVVIECRSLLGGYYENHHFLSLKKTGKNTASVPLSFGAEIRRVPW